MAFIKDKKGNDVKEGLPIVFEPPENCRHVVEGVVNKCREILPLTPQQPHLKELTVTVVYRFLFPANATQLDNMWIVVKPSDAEKPIVV